MIKKGIIPDKNAIKVREDSVLTTNGIIQSTIYKGVIKIQDESFPMEFILADLGDTVPFQILLGRNILDQLNAFLFGKSKYFYCVKHLKSFSH